MFYKEESTKLVVLLGEFREKSGDYEFDFFGFPQNYDIDKAVKSILADEASHYAEKRFEDLSYLRINGYRQYEII